MKAALFTILAAITCFMIVVFILNIRQGRLEAYFGASLTPVEPVPPPDPIAAGLIPAEVKHACPTCGECVHPVEIVKSQRTLRITDHHRWFQLFNSRDRILYFDDPVFLAGNLANPRAEDPKGFWSILARVGPARHEAGNAHPCGEIVQEFQAFYELCSRETPYEDEVEAVTPYLTLPVTVKMLSRRYEKCDHLPPVLHFSWRQAHGFDLGGAFPCPCGKP